jgi:hypothetical protein
MDAFSVNHQKTTNKWLACYSVYHKYKINRVETEPFRPGATAKSTFTIVCPEEDWKLLIEEFDNADTPIVMKPFCDAANIISSLITVSHKNGGTYQWVNGFNGGTHERK